MFKLENIMRSFAPAVLAYAALLIVSALAQPSPRFGSDTIDLERRIANLESVNADRRLAVLETIQREAEDQAFWSRVTSGGTGLLLVEASVRLIRRRKETL